MAQLAPIRALRYDDASLPDVLAPPYDVIGTADRAVLAARSPHNIVHVDLPLGEGDAKYEVAAAQLRTWLAQGVLRRDEAPALIRYTQTFEPPGGGAPVTRAGFFALVRAEPYEAKVVLPHERTLSGPKEDRYKLFRATRAALSPVFFLYDDTTGAVDEALSHAPDDTTLRTEDGITHRIARVHDPRAHVRVAEVLKDASLLIADGHHRYETTLRYGAQLDAERAEAGLPAAPDGAHKFVLAFLCNTRDAGLRVFATHRIVHGLAPIDREAFLTAARATFDVTPVDGLGDVAHAGSAFVARLAAAPAEAHAIGVAFPDGASFELTLRKDVDLDAHPALADVPAVLRRSDVVLLHNVLLEHVLGISREAQAAKTNLRYPQDPNAALAQVQGGEGQVLFFLNPTPVELVRRVCESGEVMPQKSTFFFPKVPTGIAIHVLDPDDAVTR